MGLKIGLSTTDDDGVGDEGLLIGLDSSPLDGEWELGVGAR
jgi:hypothetical protein